MSKTAKSLNKLASPPFRAAGFATRLKAFAFDYLVISAYIITLTAGTMVVIKVAGLLGVGLRWPEKPILADMLAFLTLVLPVSLYFALSESSSQQATWGKGKVGLRVVTANGGRLTRLQAILRAAVKFAPWQIAHTSLFNIPGWPFQVSTIPPAVGALNGLVFALAGWYIALAIFSKNHRTPYDWVSGSYVIID